MKKLLTILLASLLCLCCVGMVACKDEPKADTYKIYSITAQGTTYNVGDEMPAGFMDSPVAITLTESYMIIKLFDNGKVETEMAGEKTSEGMTWSQEGDVITVVTVSEYEGETYSYETVFTVDGEYISSEMGPGVIAKFKKA
ncbi:MAG: hypothetical protein E7347_04190 [Clostridiales bacterium]|nr:hypothetical protein [Clostridiales bacterium]